MACLQISRSGLTPCLGLGSDFRRKTNFFCLEFDLSRSPKRRSFKLSAERSLRICCRLEKGEGESNGEEPPESLFMKELKRRGMTPSSLREDSNRGLYDVSESEINSGEDNRGTSKRNGVVSAEFEKSLSNQRERSLALNSEGLEGLIPRAKLLLTFGGTFFLGFWPLILVTVASFSALYFYLGPNFVHDASQAPVSPPYTDPYKLLEDERPSQSAPRVN